MAESAHQESADAQATLSPDIDALVLSLRAVGAQRFDPMRMHYIEVLAKRASQHQGSVRRVLDAKLVLASTSLAVRLEQARSAARQMLEQTILQHPQAADALQPLFVAGDFKELERAITLLARGDDSASLVVLVRQLERHVPETRDTRQTGNPGSRSELQTIRDFRNTWSKLSVDKQLGHALKQAPKNAGPINSHILMLRSLALMRDVAPDYLNRFMSYADTLLCLDQCDDEKPGKPKKAAAQPGSRQPKSKP